MSPVGVVNSNCPPHSPRSTNAAESDARATATAPPATALPDSGPTAVLADSVPTAALADSVPAPGMSEPSLGYAYHPYPPGPPPMYGGPGPYQNPGPYPYSGSYGGPQPYQNPGPYRNSGSYGGPQPYGTTGPPNTVVDMHPVYRDGPSYQSSDNDTKWPWDSIDFAGTSFSDKAIRKKFVAKVYSLLFLQLCITFAVMAVCILIEPVRLFIEKHPWVYMVAVALFIVLYLSLICFQSLRRNVPGNYIALFVFTLVMSFMVAVVSTRYTVNSVLMSVGVTAGMTLCLTIFALQTKIDFTPCFGLMCGLTVLIVFLVIASVVSAAIWGPSSIWRAVLGSVAAFLFSLFIIYDTQMLMGGRQMEISPEEYVFAALQLYVDIIDLFLIILQCFLGDRR